MHEVNTGAAGLRPARWLRVWVGRSRTSLRRTRSPHSLNSFRHMRSVSRLTLSLAVLVIAVTVIGLAIGYRSGQRSDEQLSSQQHATLRNTIAEFSAPIGRKGEIDRRLMRLARQIAGVSNLKFDRNADADGREIQPVMDMDGRIVGFFTWEKSAPAAQTFKRLAPLVSIVAIVLAGFAGLRFGNSGVRVTNLR